MEFIPAACCCVTYSMFRSSVLTLSSDRLCGRIRGVGRSLEQRLALLKADLRRLSDPKQRLMPCVWDAWVGFTRQARKRQQPALQMREVQRTAFAAARCLRAWAEAARPLRQAGTADQMAAKSLHPALERLAAGLYELERSSAAKESELLRLATRLSRALFEELQDARHSLAYAQERLSHLQILVANDRRKQMGHGSLTQAAAKDFNGWVGDQKSGLHQSTMHRLIYAIFMSLQLQASTSPGAAKSPGITKLCRTRNRVQLHPTPLPRMICACGVSCSDHQRLRRSPPAPRRLLAHLCAAGGLGGCELRRFLRSCARPPQPALRIARRRAQRRLQGRLREEGFRLSPSPFSSDGFFVAAVDELNCQAPTLGRSLAHRRGEVYGQETTSTLPVEVLGAALRRHQISPEYVLDLCAAPGSKLHSPVRGARAQAGQSVFDYRHVQTGAMASIWRHVTSAASTLCENRMYMTSTENMLQEQVLQLQSALEEMRNLLNHAQMISQELRAQLKEERRRNRLGSTEQQHARQTEAALIEALLADRIRLTDHLEEMKCKFQAQDSELEHVRNELEESKAELHRQIHLNASRDSEMELLGALMEHASYGLTARVAARQKSDQQLSQELDVVQAQKAPKEWQSAKAELPIQIAGREAAELRRELEDLQHKLEDEEAVNKLQHASLITLRNRHTAFQVEATQLMSQLPSGTVLIANEFREDRARLLRANLLRSGACQALVSSLDGRRFGELCPEAFDAILVDAPCSGEGNIRKDPKAFDRWSGCDSLRLEASAPQLQMANEEHQDLTHLEKLKANSAGGRMENVMKGSIERFRSSTTRRKQEVAQLEDHSDEENSPVAGERASKDPTPRSRLMEHEDSSEINQPIWHSHPDILPPSEAQDSPEDLRGCRTLPRTPRLPAALMLRKSLASTPDKRQHVVAFIQALLKMVTSWLVATSLKKYAYLRENMPDAVEERLPFVWTCFALLEKLQFGYCILSTNVSGAKKLWAIKRTRETAGPELQLFDVPIGEYSATPGRRLFENSRPPLPCLYRSPIQLVQNHCESIQAGVSLSGSVVLQATRLWNAPLEEKGTLIPMRDIDERLGVSVGMILSHLNRDHAPVQSAVAFIESHLVDAWFYTDIGSGQRRMRIPPVALPTFSLDAAADGEGNVDFYLLHVRHGDYHILLTCCEVDLRAWHLLADGASAPNSIEMQVLRTQYCPVYRRCCGSDHASYVAGEVENDTKKPKVLDYFSTTSAYCFNDEKFRPIKSMEPGASRSPKASFDHEIEIDGERYAEDPDPTLHEKIDSKERKQRAKTAAKAKPKQPVKPKNELKAWEVASRRQGRSLHGECTWRHCERRSDDARPRTGQSYQGPRSLEQARAGQRPTACCTAVRACPGGWNVEAAGWIWRC
eukprot:s1949_g13.t4